MNRFIFIVMILMVITPAFAEEHSQQELITRGFDYIKSGDYQKAENVFSRVLLHNSNYIKSGHYQNAENVFSTLILDNLREADVYFGLGICHLKIGDSEVMTNAKMVKKAIADFKNAQKLGADYKEIHYYLGLCYLAIQGKEAAQREYSILKDLDSELANQLLVRIDAYKLPAQYTRGEVIHYDSAGRRISEAEYREMEMIEEMIKAGKKAERRAIEAERKPRISVTIHGAPPTNIDDDPYGSILDEGSRGGAVNPRTGDFYPRMRDGVINPRTGDFYPPFRDGYINPRTGDFMPKIK